MVNARERQPWYGALNPLTGESTTILADAGNGYGTALVVAYLRKHSQDKRLRICWDGASYHRRQEMHA